MGELQALVVRHLREAGRSRGVRVSMLALGLLLLAVLLGLGGDGHASSTALLAGLVGAGVAAVAAAAAGGTVLPADRVEGREAWLATLAPPTALRRLPAVLGGSILAVAVGLGACVLLALLLPLVAPDLAVRRAAALAVAPGTRLPRGEPEEGLLLAVPERSGDALSLAVVFRPLYFGDPSRADVGSPLRVTWSHAGSRGTATLAYGRRVVFDLPPGTESVRLASASRAADLYVTEAHVLGAHAPLFATLLLAGLLLGGVAGLLSPFAVALSRFTSGATAVLATLLLALVGASRSFFLGLAPTGGGATEDLGLEVVGFVARLAPDLSVLGALGDPLAGRALPVAALAGLLPLLPWAVVATLAAVLPLPEAEAVA